ncbi:MAG: hypothetical protein DCF15_03480, partial [Phormidesmis priestleyi]
MAHLEDDLWNQVLAKLEGQLSGPTFETWIKPTRIQTLTDQQLVLLTDNPFARNWLQKHYLTQISQVAAEVIGHAVDVSITVKTNGIATPVPSDALPATATGHNTERRNERPYEKNGEKNGEKTGERADSEFPDLN